MRPGILTTESFSVNGSPRRETAAQTPARLAYRDLVQPGATVLDTSAGNGDEAAVLIGLVGRRGRVHGMEGDPLLFAEGLIQTSSQGSCRLLHAVAHRQSGGVADVQGWRNGGPYSASVRTVAVDDYCTRHRLAPTLLRIGGVHASAALAGASRMLKRVRPAVVVCGEAASDTRVVTALAGQGYAVYDGRAYGPLTPGDGGSTPAPDLLVCVPAPGRTERLRGPWRVPPTTRDHVAVELAPDTSTGAGSASGYFFATAGRWLVTVVVRSAWPCVTHLTVTDELGRSISSEPASAGPSAATYHLVFDRAEPGGTRLTAAGHPRAAVISGTALVREVQF